MLLKKKYYEKEKFEEAWFNSSMIYYTKMVEDENDNIGDLTVVFKNGTAYKYKKVLFEDYVLLIAGGTDASQGKTLNKLIKSKYEFERLDSPDMVLLDNRYQELLKEGDLRLKTYFISGEDTLTNDEFEINYEISMDNAINSCEDAHFIFQNNLFGAKLQHYLLDIVSVNPSQITIYHLGVDDSGIDDRIETRIGGFEDEISMDKAMTKNSAFDIAYIKENEESSRTAKNILRRQLIISY